MPVMKFRCVGLLLLGWAACQTSLRAQASGESGSASFSIQTKPAEGTSASQRLRIGAAGSESQGQRVAIGQTAKRGTELTDANPAELPKGRFFALLMGVSDYTHPGMNDLRHPVGDARRLSEVLLQRYGFEPAATTVLSNPTRSAVMDALQRLRGQTLPDDNVLIFYAGHGVWDEDAKQGYWQPADSDPTLTSTWISNSSIVDALRPLKARHVLLVTDACFGGTISTRGGTVDPYVTANYRPKSRKVMTSGAKEPVPDQSVFLDYLLKRLSDNKDEYLSSRILFSRLEQAVTNNSPTQQRPQHETLLNAGDEGGLFFFPLKKIK